MAKRKIDSRAKGARGERSGAKAWSETFNVNSFRGCQFAGGPDSPDIKTDHTEIHVEVKRTEKGNPYNWLAQAVVDARGKVPVVLHRRNREEWVLIMRLQDAPRFAEEIHRQGQTLADETLPSEIQDSDQAGGRKDSARPSGGMVSRERGTGSDTAEERPEQ